jgi:acyl-CoA thioesterase FadM
MKYFAYSQKEFVYKYVVMLSDTDQFQHMSFANYLRLMFLATDALLLNCCNQKFLSQYRLVLDKSRMQFKRQTVAGDQILIKVNASSITNSQYTLLFTFVFEGTGELVALGRQVYQALDIKNPGAKHIPRDIENLLIPIKVEEDYLLYKY